jgi:hypothetical protein
MGVSSTPSTNGSVSAGSRFRTANETSIKAFDRLKIFQAVAGVIYRQFAVEVRCEFIQRVRAVDEFGPASRDAAPGRCAALASCQEPMGDAPGRVRADDVALRIDTLGRSG